MKCPNCRSENPPAAKFCPECGTKLQRVCAQCGTELPPTARFCLECGAPLSGAPAAAPSVPSPNLEREFAALQQAMPDSLRRQILTPEEGENRIVTVLFADMSRSVQSTGHLHPEDAAALVNHLLKAMVDILLKYEGRIDKLLGDGVLAVFGVPQAHESDPERAIMAATEIRAAARQLGQEVTAGINTGEVYVGGVGSDRHQEVTVMGPVVNLAARLEDAAEPGQILAGEATHRHTRRAFAFTLLALELKGIPGPVTAYAVERALPRPEKARGIDGLRAELIGRDAELAMLTEALAELRRGRGQMVSLIGEAGVGKSRLVSELKQGVGCWVLGVGNGTPGSRLDAPPGALDTQHPTPNTQHPTPLWLEGRCLELGMTASYWLFIDLFREYFAWRPEDDDRTRGERIAAALRELVERGDLTEERFEEMGPLLGHLLSVRFGSAWDGRLKDASPEQIKNQTFLAIRDFFAALAKRQPVILVFEDLHWADSLSLDAISLLMETLTRDSLLMLCVYRPEREHKCARLGTIASQKCAGRYTEIPLRELTPQQSRRLVESLLTIDQLPAPVKELILEKSHGNPFFVEEVIRSLIDAGMVYREGDAWQARDGIETVAVPESVQSVILSRVDRLERDLKRVLESASVIGRLFRRRLLEHTIDQTRELERDLWELEDRALIYQERVVPEAEYSFKHVLTQETIYESILRRRRPAFHQKVAEAIEQLYREGLDEYYEQLAYHYERSGVDEKAVEYLLKAGEKSRRAYLNDEAIGYFQRALDRLDAPASEIRNPKSEIGLGWRLIALKALGQIYLVTGRVPEAEARLRQAVEIAQELRLPPREIVRSYHWLGEALSAQRRLEEAMRLGEEGLALLGDDRDSVEAALMLLRIAQWQQARANWDAWNTLVSRMARSLSSDSYSEELRPVYDAVIAQCYYHKDQAAAARWIDRLGQMAEQRHDYVMLGDVHSMAAYRLVTSGDLRGATARQLRGAELAARIGNVGGECWQLLSAGWTSLMSGDLARAEEYTRRGGRLAEAIGANPLYIGRTHDQLGHIFLCQGAPAQAAVEFQKTRDLFIPTRFPRDALVTAYLGRAEMAQGQPQDAARHFEEAIMLAAAKLQTSADDGRTEGIVPLVDRPVQEQPEARSSFARWWYRQAFRIALSGIEDALQGREEALAFWDRLQAEHPEIKALGSISWPLRPARPAGFPRRTARDELCDALPSAWTWHDPCGECRFTVQRGLEIRTVNGQALARYNQTAPRLLQPGPEGAFAIQTECGVVSPAQPAIGGLVLWRDEENYLLLERGSEGWADIAFRGCLGNEDRIFGHGRLPGDTVLLRLECEGGRVRALCSADGSAWYTAGEVEWPAGLPVHVGLFAVGQIDRTAYPSAYPEGTAIRFASFQMMEP